MTAISHTPHPVPPQSPEGNTRRATPSAPVAVAARPTVEQPIQFRKPRETVATTPAPAPQADPISHFIDLEIEARQCPDLDALRYAIVNSTRKLAAFDQAFLAEPTLTGGWNVTRAASVSKVDRHSPLIRAITAWLQHPNHAGKKPCDVRLANIEQEARAWNLEAETIAFPNALWLPMKGRNGEVLAALIALKKENWRPQHSALMMPLVSTYAHAWEALAPKTAAPIQRARGYVSKSRLALVLALISLIAAFVPVSLSALAPSEIVASEPMLVTAPIEGVIGEILAPPGAWVEKGTPIVKYVDVKLRSDAEIAARNMAVVEARHFKIVQSAIATQKDMQELATAKAELDLANAELNFARAMLERSEIRAERSGLLIYSSKSDWIGKPVAVGERLMEIGDPAKTEVRIELPVSDAIALQLGGKVSLFLDGDPLRSIDATIARASYRPALTAEQQLAFRVHAKFSDGNARRIGLRGIARVSGETVPLWFYLFRRPISTVRQKVGL